VVGATNAVQLSSSLPSIFNSPGLSVTVKTQQELSRSHPLPPIYKISTPIPILLNSLQHPKTHKYFSSQLF
jgi:hypothetical protein